MKVYTKRAAKDYPEFGVKRGDVYYEWCHYRQKPQKSKTYPKESQLTADGDLAEAMVAFESLDPSKDYTAEEVRELVETLEGCKDSMAERLENVPEGLRDGHPLEEKISNLESTITALEELADGLESADEDDEDTCGSDQIDQCREF